MDIYADNRPLLIIPDNVYYQKLLIPTRPIKLSNGVTMIPRFYYDYQDSDGNILKEDQIKPQNWCINLIQEVKYSFGLDDNKTNIIYDSLVIKSQNIKTVGDFNRIKDHAYILAKS